MVAVSAGLTHPSSTRLLADRLAAATARDLPGETEVIAIELRELAHDIVNNLLTGFPSPALRAAIGQVRRADGLIAATPLYSGSYNGLFKSFFDVLDVFAATEDWGTAGSCGSSLTARIERAGAELAAAVGQPPVAVEADPYASAPSFGELLRHR